MLKGNNKYYLLLLLMFAFLVWVEYSTPKPVDWRRTYSKDDKIPFGCNAFYRLINEDIFKGRVERQKKTPFTALLSAPEKRTGYVFINNDLPLSKLDCDYLMKFVEKGNDVFMSAGSFYENGIADTFDIHTKHFYNYYPESTDSNKKYTLNFSNLSLREKKPFAYKKGFELGYFDRFDTSKVSVLATEGDTNAVFLKAKWGAGNFYFLSVPDVFTNYFVVNDSARFFAYKALSYVNGEQFWWDEHYKNTGVNTDSPLQFIFSNDSLYTAYLLSMFSLIIFMIFAMKRRQRAIPVVEPITNTTLQFVEVVGSVYYNSKNHKIIAEEKINSFYEFLRAKFMITNRKIDEETFLRIAKLSTISLREIKKLFRVIGIVLQQTSITEKELIELNVSIEKFHKLNKR